MDHHPHAKVFLARIAKKYLPSEEAPSNRAKPKPKEKRLTPKQKIELKAQLLKWSRSLTVDYVVLTSDGKDVNTLSGRVWKDIALDTCWAFIKLKKVAVPQRKCKKDMLGKFIAGKINSKPFKGQVTASNKKESNNALTKPACLTKDGTLYKLMNVITSKQGRPAYLKTKKSQDKKIKTQGTQKLLQSKRWDVCTTIPIVGTISLMMEQLMPSLGSLCCLVFAKTATSSILSRWTP